MRKIREAKAALEAQGQAEAEQAAVAGMYEEASHLALSSLKQAGLAEYVAHATPHTPSCRRWRLTGEGLGHLAAEEGASVDRLLRTRPVSARWQHLLLARLEAVMGNSETPPECSVPDWNRTVALNAALEAGDLNNIMGIMGEMARAHRIRRLAQETDLGEKSLYESMRAGANPEFNTVLRVLRALGFRLQVESIIDKGSE